MIIMEALSARVEINAMDRIACACGVLEVNGCEGYLVSVCEREGLIIRNT